MAYAKKGKRPKSGEIQQGEPTEAEIVAGAANIPSDEVVATLGGVEFPMVELGFMDWRVYMTSLLPSVEQATKSLLPLITNGARAWDLVKGTDTRNIRAVRDAALTGDIETLVEALELAGLNNATTEEISHLIEVAEDDGAFAADIAALTARPMLNLLSEISISDILIKAMDKIPDMALVSLAASMERRGLSVDRKQLRLQIEANDGFELFNVVMAQIVHYQQRGKLRSFFEQMKSLMMVKMSPTQKAALGMLSA